MNWQPHASQRALDARAKLNQQIRAFFQAKNVLEVETPIINSHAVTDAQIESIATEGNGISAYLS